MHMDIVVAVLFLIAFTVIDRLIEDSWWWEIEKRREE